MDSIEIKQWTRMQITKLSENQQRKRIVRERKIDLNEKPYTTKQNNNNSIMNHHHNINTSSCTAQKRPN